MTVDKLVARGLGSILDEVASAHGLTREQLCGRRRTGPIARARHELYSRLRDERLTYDAIGDLFGRVHSTIVRGIIEYRNSPRFAAPSSGKSSARPTSKAVINGATDLATLKNKIEELATEFAVRLLEALRTASFAELADVAETDTPPRRASRARNLGRAPRKRT